MAHINILKRIWAWFRRTPPPEPEEAQPLEDLPPRIDGNELWLRWPPGLVRKLCPYLSPVDRLSLSLACHWTSAAIGRRRGVLQGRCLFEFLLRLERDGAFADAILCSICIKFHTPRRSPDYDITIAARQCIQYGTSAVLKQVTSDHLPRQVHFDLIAAQTRTQRHRQKEKGLVGAYTPQTLFTSHMFWDKLGTDRAWNYITCRVKSGHFILKTEHVLLPAEDPKDVLQGAENLFRMLHQRKMLGWCCAHVHWTTCLPYLFHPEVELFPTRGYADTHLHQCLWTHNNCKGFMYGNTRIKKCGDIVSQDLGNVMGCIYCATDFTLNIKRSESGINMLVLTSWKDLGQGINVADPCWRSHLETQPGTRRRRPESCYYGQVFRNFEMRGPKYVPSYKMWQQCNEKMRLERETAFQANPRPEREMLPSKRTFDKSLSSSSRARARTREADDESSGTSSSFYGSAPELPTLPSPVALDPMDDFFGLDNLHVDDKEWS